MKTICVYCGSKIGNRPVYRHAAEQLGDQLLQHNIALVYGGGNIGLMGKIADRVIDGGGRVTGVMPKSLTRYEIAHPGAHEFKVVDGMHERKALMADLADGFIALPGGFGTQEELLEALTWTQLGFHQKPCALLNVDGFYDHLLDFLNHARAEGFIKPQHRDLLIVEREPAALLARMQETCQQMGTND